MGKIQWYFNRLRAMSLPEIGWRLQQKRLQNKERSLYGSNERAVIGSLFDARLETLKFHPEALGINFSHKTFGTQTSIHLLGGYSYDAYKKRWNAGFQTENEWSNEFSYSLNYKQRDDIGDARTNWELNRHFQFALLAKAYYVTKDKKYLDDLKELFYDWNAKNPFLHGISWTSVMEVAIRCIQWCVTLTFLSSCKSSVEEKLLSDLETGIKNMAAYIALHYSRFSSANNHLLVEATAIAYAGFAFDYDVLKNLSIRILDEELMKQNYSDGVNKEMSLHYQTFGMEAYALVMHLMQSNGLKVPQKWKDMLAKQCEFVSCSMISETKACEFGDNDEGKILDLEGGEISHYRYVLQICSLVLGQRYESFAHPSETVRWLFDDFDIAKCKQLPLYDNSVSRTFPQGGYTFLRSNDGKVVVGIDHAPLGFGSIAAHGHADALSFQLYVDGQCILGDPDTFIYHCWLDKRNEYRKSRNHNTVWVEEDEQSQMLGAFLWGKKAQTVLKDNSFNSEKDTVAAGSTWQNGNVHLRIITFDKKQPMISIRDSLQSGSESYTTLMVHPKCKVAIEGDSVNIQCGEVQVKISADSSPTLKEACYSEQYGIEQKTHKIIYKLNENKLNTTIWIEKY